MNRAPVKTLIALDEGIEASMVEAALPLDSPLQIVGIGDGIDRSWTLLEQSSPELLLVVTSGHSEPALHLIEGAARQRPDRPIVVFATGSPNGFLQRAFAAGADDLIVLPTTPEHVDFTLEKTLARTRGTAPDVEQAPLICVLGPKGGTGKTLTACNLAVAFAKAGKRTALVDLDLQFGDVGIALGLTPERTIYDLAHAGGSIDAEKLESYLTVHPASGARVLLAPTRPDQAGLISVDFLREVYTLLRVSSDVVVVDTSPSFSPEVIATIDVATDLAVVGMLDALSLKDSKLGLETLELMGHNNGKIKLVLNRSSAKVGITREEAEAVLGRTPDVFVPEDRDIPRTVTEGRPIVLASERSPASKAFTGFASGYLAEFEPAPNQPRADINHRPRGLRRLRLGRGRS
jgi:pilus assembly protein CpaE